MHLFISLFTTAWMFEKKKYPILVKKQNKQVCWAEALYYLLSARLVHNREASAHYFKLKKWNIENKIKPKLGAFTFYNQHGWQKQFTTIQNQLYLKLHLKVDHEKLVKEQSSLNIACLLFAAIIPDLILSVEWDFQLQMWCILSFVYNLHPFIWYLQNITFNIGAERFKANESLGLSECFTP